MTAEEIAAQIEQILTTQKEAIPVEEQVKAILSPHAWREWQRYVEANPADSTVVTLSAELKSDGKPIAIDPTPITPTGDTPIA